MKLSQFEPAIQRNVLQGQVRLPANTEAYGAGTAGTQVMGNALGGAADFLMKKWIKDEDDKTIDAVNEYNRQVNSLLYDENNGIYVKYQGKNAEQAQSAFEEGEKKIRENFLGNLSSEYATGEFLKHIEPSVTSNLGQIDKFQRTEADNYANAQVNDIWSNTANNALKNPANLASGISSSLQLTRKILTNRQITDPETMAMKEKECMNTLAKNYLSTLIQTGDYNQMLKDIPTLRAAGADETILKPFQDNAASKSIIKETKDGMQKYLSGKNIYTVNAHDAAVKYVDSILSGGTVSHEQADRNYEAGKNAWMGQIPDNGPVGCVEAVTKMGSYFSPFLKKELDNGVVNVDRLVDDARAENSGVSVVEFDESKLEKGDIIVYDTSEPQGHVTIADGNGGYIGNMSSANGHRGGIGESNNLYDPGTPVRIIKTGLYSGKGIDPYEGMSDDEKESLRQKRIDAAESEILELKRQASQAAGATALTARQTLLQMKQDNKSVSDMINYVDDLGTMDDNFKNSEYYINIMGGLMNRKQSTAVAGAVQKNDSLGIGRDGYAKDKHVSYLTSLFGNEIQTDQKLDEVLKNYNDTGIYFSAEQIEKIKGKWAMYQNGEGQYKLPVEDDDWIRNNFGVTGKITEPMKAQVRQEMYEYMTTHNINNYSQLSRDEIMTLYGNVFWKMNATQTTGGTDIPIIGNVGGTTTSVDFNAGQLRDRGILYARANRDDNGKIKNFAVESRKTGRIYYISLEDLQAILDGRKSINIDFDTAEYGW